MQVNKKVFLIFIKFINIKIIENALLFCNKQHKDIIMQAEKINLNLKKTIDYSYDVFVSPGLLNQIPEKFEKMGLKKEKFVIITDSNVKDLYAMPLYKNLNTNGFTGNLFSFKAGEKYKTRKTKQKLENFLLEKQFGRDTYIIAVGGGVCGDIAGFLAATYMRGIPFIQVPTTILAMVDSSVGGKTGVDTKAGKNLIGAFHQPKAVIIDPETLKTLEYAERLNGIAEMIKHACIRSKELFEDLIKYKDEIINVNSAVLSGIIAKNVEIKARVVEQDEKESNLRMILNYGHTTGHAIELLSNYKMGHGECVAIGMVVSCEISVLLGLMKRDTADTIINTISDFGLPVNVPSNVSIQDFLNAIKLDKKSRDKKAKFILINDIGDLYSENGNYGIEVDEEILIKAVNARRN